MIFRYLLNGYKNQLKTEPLHQGKCITLQFTK